MQAPCVSGNNMDVYQICVRIMGSPGSGVRAGRLDFFFRTLLEMGHTGPLSGRALFNSYRARLNATGNAGAVFMQTDWNCCCEVCCLGNFTINLLLCDGAPPNLQPSGERVLMCARCLKHWQSTSRCKCSHQSLFSKQVEHRKGNRSNLVSDQQEVVEERLAAIHQK